ncbi:MAG: hypothetical protein ACFFB5_07965 [Promethearchaeota archaeon]
MEIQRIKGTYMAINIFLLILLSSMIVGVFTIPSTDKNLCESGSSPCQILADDYSNSEIKQKEEITQPRLTHWYGSVYPEATIEVTAFTEHTMQMFGYGNDTLRFNMRFKPKQNAHYSGTAYLYKGGSQVGVSASWSGEITANVETVALFDFCGYAINEVGFAGPYDIRLTFYKNNGTSYTIYDDEIVLVTEAYKVDDFLPYPITVNEASISFDFLDRDSNSKYEWIYVRIPVTVSMPSTYYFKGRVNPSTIGGVSDYAYNNTYLGLGSHTVTLKFPGWKFVDMSGSDSLELDWLYIRHDDPPTYELYSNSDIYTTNICNPSDFDVPPVVPTGQFWDSLIDSDYDGFNDYYQVEMEVNVLRIESGWWNMYASLYINSTNTYITYDWASGFYIEDVGLGIRNVVFDFNGIHIYQSEILNDHFLLSNIQGDYSDYYTDSYSFSGVEWISDSLYNYNTFEGPGAYLTHNFNDNGDDTDGDGLWDWLVIDVEVVVTKIGYYHVGAWLDIASNYVNIDYASNSSHFTIIGTYWLQLRFEGDKFFRSGVNGLVKFDDLELYGGDPWADLDNNNSATFGPYIFTDFDPPKARLTGIYSDHVEETNGNGLWDELQIFVEVEINETGKYAMQGRLRNPITKETYYVTTDTQQILNAGTHQFILAFPGEWIFSQLTITTYTLEYVEIYEVDDYDNLVKQWDYREDNFVTDLVYNSDDFERPPAYFTGDHFDSGVDTDADGKYNYIELKIEVEINTPGKYYVYGRIYAIEGDYGVTVSSEWLTLDKGQYNLTFQIDRYWVFNQPDGDTFYLSYKYIEQEDSGQCDYSEEDYYFLNIYHHDDFDPPGIALTGNFYDYGVDDDSNGKYDYLEFAIEVSVTESGNYSIWGYICADEGGEDFNFENKTYLTVGTHNFTFKIADWWIRYHESEAQIYINYFYVNQYIVDEGWYERIHEEDNHLFSRTYAHTEFDDPAVSLTDNIYDQGVDTDSNGRFDYIEIKIEIEVTEAAEYYASGNIYSTTSEGGYYYFSTSWSYFAVGTHNLTIQLDSRYIFGQPAGTLYYINYLYIESDDGLVLKEDDDLYLPGTYTSADVDYPDAWVTRIFDYGVDLDSDGFFDLLRVDFEVNVTVSGIDILIEAELSQIWDYTEVNLYDLPIGLYNVSLDFLGKHLYDSGFTMSGELYIDYYQLIRTDDWMIIYESWDNVYLKNSYTYDDFDSEYTTFIEILSVSQPDDNGQYYLDEELSLVVTIHKESTEGVDRVIVCFDHDYGDVWMNQVLSNETHEIWQIDIYLWYSGDYNLVIEAWGTWVSFDSVELSINIATERGLPIIHSFSVNSSHCEVTEAIKFSAVVSDDDGIDKVTLHVKREDILMTYIEDVTDGELWETIVTFDEAGSYTADIRVTDKRGQTSDSGRITINVNEWDPIISVEILPGTEIEVGTEITFTMVLRKGDAIITSVVVEVEYIGSYALEKTDEDETTETYSFDYVVTRSGEFLCTMTIMNTRNQVAVYEQVITVIGDPDANVTPGFEWLLALGFLSLLPIVRKRLKN